VLTLWIHLRIDWINFGKTKKFCIIGKLIFVPGVLPPLDLRSDFFSTTTTTTTTAVYTSVMHTRYAKTCYVGRYAVTPLRILYQTSA